MKPVLSILHLPFALPLLFTAACATVAPPELVEARQSYARASTGPAQQLDPAALHEAKTALDVAEDEFKRDATGQRVKDRAYIADRMARIAESRAGVVHANNNADRSRALMSTLAAKQYADLKTTRAALDQTRNRDRRTHEELQKAELELREAATALEEARAKGALTTAELAEKQTEIELAEQALKTEREARLDAEARAKEALNSLAAMAQVKEEPRGVVITLSGAVLFASGKHVLLPAARVALDNVASVLLANPDREIVVEGHTDSQGADSFNTVLAKDRAASVRVYLVDKGVPPEVISAVGMGSTRPIADNKTAEGRANNRRVEIIVSPAERK